MTSIQMQNTQERANVADPPGKRCNQIALAPGDQFSPQHPSVIFFVHNYHYIDAPPLSATCTCYLKADSFDAATNLTHLTAFEHCCLSLLFFKTFIPLHYSPQLIQKEHSSSVLFLNIQLQFILVHKKFQMQIFSKNLQESNIKSVEPEVKRATLTGWSFMLCNQILPSIGNAFSCIGEALFTCKPI
ncbi:hypothetical protein T11_4973 [Trichinella zimbabwensis]|uniref:Uncharacterized protein n=1 Tax=Trichinella zimbabwensis TaxID=268475 RepID=A0A0V1HAW7_9BILA|nr:hypothetical protein T11_4973 [Trichinella zimbabwensis]